MNIETLRLTRNILFRSFVIGILITLILCGVTVGYWTAWTPLAVKWLHTDVETLTPLVLKFFMNVRFFLLYILLTPALALHWTFKCESKKHK